MRVTLALAIVLLTGSATAHDWFPSDCCSMQDCKEVPCDQVVEVEGGWKFIGEEFVFKGKQVRESPPGAKGKCGICIAVYPDDYGEGAPARVPLCIFKFSGS